MTRADALAVWSVLALAVVLAEVLAHLGRHRVRSFASLAALLLARTPTRLVLLVGWMWLGWHSFAR
jgi:hypothetical protein